MPEDDIPERGTALEAEMGRMREELTTVRADAAAARVQAGGADHDVSEVRAELRAHTRAIGALQLRRGRAAVRHRAGGPAADRRPDRADHPGIGPPRRSLHPT